VTTLPGLEQYAEGGDFPCPYVPHFLTAAQADEFFEFFSKWDYCQATNEYGVTLRRKGAAFVPSDYLRHSQVMGVNNAAGKTVLTDSSTLEDEHCDGPVLPSNQAPECLRHLQQKLTAHLRTIPGYEKRTINCLSVLLYPDEQAGIDWHWHKEDYGIDTPTLLFSCGAERQLFIGKASKSKQPQPDPATVSSKVAEHGSLIVIPDAMNYTHWHAILKDEAKNTKYGLLRGSYGPRVSVNCKCLVTPHVFSLKTRRFPRFGVYVGCKFAYMEGSVYGNGKDPFKGHYPAIASNEADFTDYVQKKMSDPTFRQKAIADLRGRHLLCWCYQDGPERAEFCHARVWLEVVNRRLEHA
jgi:hypothetical protein